MFFCTINMQHDHSPLCLNTWRVYSKQWEDLDKCLKAECGQRTNARLKRESVSYIHTESLKCKIQIFLLLRVFNLQLWRHMWLFGPSAAALWSFDLNTRWILMLFLLLTTEKYNFSSFSVNLFANMLETTNTRSKTSDHASSLLTTLIFQFFRFFSPQIHQEYICNTWKIRCWEVSF